MKSTSPGQSSTHFGHLTLTRTTLRTTKRIPITPIIVIWERSQFTHKTRRHQAMAMINQISHFTFQFPQRHLSENMGVPSPLLEIGCCPRGWHTVRRPSAPCQFRAKPYTLSNTPIPIKRSNCSSTCPGSGPPVTRSPSSMLMMKACLVRFALDKNSQVFHPVKSSRPIACAILRRCCLTACGSFRSRDCTTITVQSSSSIA